MCSKIFLFIFFRHYGTTTSVESGSLMQCFSSVEDANTRGRIFLSPSKLGFGPNNSDSPIYEILSELE